MASQLGKALSEWEVKGPGWTGSSDLNAGSSSWTGGRVAEAPLALFRQVAWFCPPSPTCSLRWGSALPEWKQMF